MGLAPAIIGFVASRYTVIGLFGAGALCQLICLVVFASLFLVPDTRVEPAALPISIEGGRSRLTRGRTIGMAGVTLLRAALFLHFMTRPLLLTTNFHGSVADVSLNAAVAAGLEVPFMLAWGYAAARTSKELSIVASALVYALYLGLLHYAGSMTDVLWLQGLNAVGTAAFVSLPISYMQEAIKGRVGLSTALMDVVVVIAFVLASALFALFAHRDDYMPAMTAAGLVSVAGALCMLFSGFGKARELAGRANS